MPDNSLILIAEDDAIIGYDIQRTLKRLGYRAPHIAQSGEEALALLSEIQPELVLMDIKLKGRLDGIETTALIRKRADVAVVYLTSHSDEVTLNRAKNTGPQGYLLKPFDERDLRTTIEVAIRKQEMEKALADRERWFSTTLESVGDAVIATDRGEHITFMNAAAETLTGWQRKDAEGKPASAVLALLDEHGAPRESPLAQALRDRLRVTLPPSTRLTQKGGEAILVDDTATPIVDDRGVLLGGVVVFRDITEQKKLEERLALSERLASIGTMAAGTAHEINNPLSAVIGNLGFAVENLSELREKLRGIPGLGDGVEEIQTTLEDAARASERIRVIVRDLKRFGRVEARQSTSVDLPDILDAAAKMAGHLLRHHARLVREYGTTPLVQANDGQLVQVFLNLLVNAAQAVGDGRASENHVTLRTFTDDAGRAVVEVRDTGCGIPPENVSRIFNPFFTTKAVGVGTGLGLSICHSIVTSIGGDISLKSEVGTGTVVRVALLPASQAPIAANDVTQKPPPSRRGNVLLVDDDPDVRAMVFRTLCRHHNVILEESGTGALARIARGETFDLILCDMMMPDMTGVDVHNALSVVNPTAANAIVFVTAGAFSERAQTFLDQTPNLVFRKPFTTSALRDFVNDLLNHPPGEKNHPPL